MGLGHEKRDVYRLGIGDVAWGYEKADGQNRKTELDRMAAMLSRLGGRGYQVREEATAHDGSPSDPDPDSDNDLDKTKPQQRG